jgi:hypothetical protein
MLYEQNKFSKVIGSFNLWSPLLHAFPPMPNLAVKVVITKFFLVFNQKLREACKRESYRFRFWDRHKELSVRSDVNEECYTLATVRRGLGIYADQRNPTSASILPRPM